MSFAFLGAFVFPLFSVFCEALCALLAKNTRIYRMDREIFYYETRRSYAIFKTAASYGRSVTVEAKTGADPSSSFVRSSWTVFS